MRELASRLWTEELKRAKTGKFYLSKICRKLTSSMKRLPRQTKYFHFSYKNRERYSTIPITFQVPHALACALVAIAWWQTVIRKSCVPACHQWKTVVCVVNVHACPIMKVQRVEVVVNANKMTLNRILALRFRITRKNFNRIACCTKLIRLETRWKTPSIPRWEKQEWVLKLVGWNLIFKPTKYVILCQLLAGSFSSRR